MRGLASFTLLLTATCGGNDAVPPDGGLPCPAEAHLAMGVCVDNTVCTDDEFEATAPTSTSDRQCELATVCAVDEYETAPLTATADRECAPIPPCAPGSVARRPESPSADPTCEPM
jgi:hypothetical protein